MIRSLSASDAKTSITSLSVPIASVIVAFIALLLAIYEGRAQRQHNRLSVRPKLGLSVSTATDSEDAYISLENSGLGPALIKSFRLLVDDKDVREIGLKNWTEVTKVLGLPQGAIYSYVGKGGVFPAGEKVKIVSVSFREKENPKERIKQIRDAFRRLGFHIKYSSFYNEPFEVRVNGKTAFGKDRFMGK